MKLLQLKSLKPAKTLFFTFSKAILLPLSNLSHQMKYFRHTVKEKVLFYLYYTKIPKPRNSFRLCSMALGS